MSDWPHDPDGEKGSEGRRKYGQAILAKKIDEGEDFPLERDAFVEEFGDDPIRIDYETIVSVADVFEHVDQERGTGPTNWPERVTGPADERSGATKR